MIAPVEYDDPPFPSSSEHFSGGPLFFFSKIIEMTPASKQKRTTEKEGKVYISFCEVRYNTLEFNSPPKKSTVDKLNYLQFTFWETFSMPLPFSLLKLSIITNTAVTAKLEIIFFGDPPFTPNIFCLPPPPTLRWKMNGPQKRWSEWYFRFNFNLGPVNIELGDPGRWRHPTFDVNVIKLKWEIIS